MHPFSSTKGLEILTKKKNIFIIGPYHYCYSVASLIEGLNKIDDVKVFSNSEHNYCSNVVNTLSVQNQVCKMADVVVLCHSAMEDKYRDIIHPLLLEVQYDIDIYLDGSDNYELENDPTKYKLYLVKYNQNLDLVRKKLLTTFNQKNFSDLLESIYNEKNYNTN